MHEDSALAVQNAERIVWVASWRIRESQVLDQLAATIGLACGRLEPQSDVIQLVTYDGEHLGHVRRDMTDNADDRWVAVPRNHTRLGAIYSSAHDAAVALAMAADKLPSD